LGSTWLSQSARKRTQSAMAASVVIPANLANTISVKSKAMRVSHSPFGSSILHLLKGSID
jgi:hypothetical protein